MTIDWAGLALSPSDWASIFTVTGSGKVATTKASLELRLQAKTQAQLFETLTKARTQDTSSFNHLKMAFDVDYSPFKIQPKLDIGKEAITLQTLERSVIAVEAGLMEAGTRLELVTDYMEHEHSVTNRTIDTVFWQVQATKDAIGITPTNLPVRFTAPSLWGTATIIIDAFLAVDTDTLSRSSREAIDLSAKGLKSANDQLQKNSLTMFKVLLDRMTKAETSIVSLQSGATSNQPSMAPSANFASLLNPPSRLKK